MAKKLGIAAAVIVGIIVVLMIILKIAINPENYRDRIISEAEKALNGRNVDIGRMELKLIGFGLKVDKLVVGNLEEFDQEEDFINVDRVEVRVGLLSLLTDTIKVKKIALVQPKLYVERNADGKVSIEDLLEAEAAAEEDVEEEPEPEKEEVPGAPAKKFFVKSIRIKGGQLTFDDLSSPTGEYVSFQIEQLDLNVTDLSLDSPIGVDIAAAIRSESQEQNFFLKGKVGPLGEDLDLKETAADLNLKFHPFKVSFLQPYYEEYLPYEVASGLLDIDIELSGSAKEGLKTSGKFGVRELAYLDKGKTWGPTEKFDLVLDHKGLARLDEKSFQVDEGTLQLGEMNLALKGSGQMTDEGLKFNAEGSSGEFQLKPFLETLGPVKKLFSDLGIELSGGSALSMKASSDAKIITATLDWNLDKAKLDYPGILRKVPGEEFKLDAKMKITDTAYTFEQLLAKLTVLELSGSGNIGTGKGLPASINFKTNSVPLNTFKSNLVLFKDYNLDGNLKLDGKITGSVENTDRLTIELSKADFVADHSDISAKGSITGFDKPEIKFDLSSKQIDFDKILAGISGDEKAGSGQVEENDQDEAAEEEGGSILARATGGGRINIAKVIYGGEPITNVKASISIGGGKWTSRDLGLNVAGGTVSMPATIDFRGKHLGYEVSPEFNNLDVNRLLSAFTGMKDSLYGTGQGKISLSGRGTEWKVAAQRLRGSGKIRMRDGLIKNMDLAGGVLGDWAKPENLKKLGKFALGDKGFEQSKETEFKVLAAAFEVKEGEVDLEKFNLRHDEGVFKMEGEFGLLDFDTELHGRAIFNKDASSDHAKRLGIPTDTPGLFDCKGRLVLALEAKGRYPSVKVGLDSKGYGEIFKENLECGLGDKLMEEGEKFLEDLFNP